MIMVGKEEGKAPCGVMVRTVIRKLEKFNRDAKKAQIARMDAGQIGFFIQVLDPMSWSTIFSNSSLDDYQAMQRKFEDLSLGVVYDERMDKLVARCLRLTAIKLAYLIATVETGKEQRGSITYYEDAETAMYMLQNSVLWEKMRKVLESWPKLGYPDPFLTAERLLNTEKWKKTERGMRNLVKLGYFESLGAAEAVYG